MLNLSKSALYLFKSNQCYLLGLNKIRPIPILLYHSKTGVFGFRPKEGYKYEVSEQELAARIQEIRFYQFVTAYREHGHKIANINPVDFNEKMEVPELLPERYGLKNEDIFKFKGILFESEVEGTLNEAVQYLQQTYCSTLSAEFTYLQDEGEKDWFSKEFEKTKHAFINRELEKQVALEMLKSQAFDKFLATKFVSLKRYGAEGAECMMAFFFRIYEICC
uniref:Uncharacterized protein n=1 Tax=Clastoptera arizonana TaxID=38151 RepID=A0A1B6CHB3_9HEMI